MSNQPQISDAEWQVMKALWEQSPITANQLCERLTPAKQWHPKTVRTMLTRLTKKRAVGTQIDDGVHHYIPLISREDSTRHATRSFLDRVFDGALAPMVAHFVARGELTAEEKRELKKLLEKHSAEKKS